MVRPALASIQIPSLAQPSASDLAERLGIVQVPALVSTQVQRQIVTPAIILDIYQTPVQTPIQITEPVTTPIITTIPWIPGPPPVPGITFPSFGWPPGGGGGDLFRMRQRRAFVEIFPIGLDISTFGGRPQVKKKQYRKKAKAKGKK